MSFNLSLHAAELLSPKVWARKSEHKSLEMKFWRRSEEGYVTKQELVSQKTVRKNIF